jgi:omega-hydroxy-beta-dihydromenaquinone-9 sulfotransferase
MNSSTRKCVRAEGYTAVCPSLRRFFRFLISDILLELQDTCSFRAHGQFNLFSLKRISFLIVASLAIPLLICWNHLGFWLDDLFYPRWRDVIVREPLFIIGNARSGTTLFHRLLSQQELFTTMSTWEIIFAASVTWKLLFGCLYRFDREVCLGLGFSLVSWMEEKVIAGLGGSRYGGVHPVGLQLAEEDEWIMVHIFASQLILLFFPLGLQINFDTSDIPSLVMFDHPSAADGSSSLAPEIRIAILEYYRSCVQKHLYVHGKGTKMIRRFLSKNPPFTLRIESLSRVFPDLKICCMIRDPVQSIPSMVSYIAKVWEVFNSPRIAYPRADELIGFCQLHYLYPLECFCGEDGRQALIGRHQWTFLSYHDLMAALALQRVQSSAAVPRISPLRDLIIDVLAKLELISADEDRTANGRIITAKIKEKELIGEIDLTFLRDNDRQYDHEFVLIGKYQSAHQHAPERCCGMTAKEVIDPNILAILTYHDMLLV